MVELRKEWVGEQRKICLDRKSNYGAKEKTVVRKIPWNPQE